MVTPTLQLDDQVSKQVQYLPHLATLYCDGLWCEFPCPNKLLEAIILVNQARWQKQGVQHGDIQLRERYMEISRLVTMFDAAEWVETTLTTLRDGIRMESSWEREPHTSLARAFQYATMLYCVGTLHADVQTCAQPSTASSLLHPTSGWDDAKATYRWALDNLLSALHGLWEKETGWSDAATSRCRKFSCWPLFIAGMALHPSRSDTAEVEQSFICDSLRHVSFDLGGCGPLDAIQSLRRLWTATRGASAAPISPPLCWDERLSIMKHSGLYIY